jgi:hypothetical protein
MMDDRKRDQPPQSPPAETKSEPTRERTETPLKEVRKSIDSLDDINPGGPNVSTSNEPPPPPE